MSSLTHEKAMGPAAIEASSKAMVAERLRTGHLLNLLRFLGTTLFLGLVGYEEVLRRVGESGTYVWVLAGYWVLSVVILGGSYASDRLTQLSSVAIPVLDVPLVWAIQLGVMQSSASPRAVAGFAIGEYMLVVMLAAMTLRGWLIGVTGITAAIAEQLLQEVAGEPDLGRLGGLVLIGMTAGLCEYARRRRVDMVGRICSERLLRERLGRYFSPHVAEQIQNQADGLARGKDCEVTVLFADLCDFTALSERLGSDRTVALLNEFHRHMVEVVFGSGGTLDKYTGDGLMVYFGAPMAQADHAVRAVECGLAMHQALAKFNLRRQELGEAPLRMRIGIHSGSAIVGSIGAPHRREFTVVGDTVNVASRLEQVAKHLEKDIVISEATRQNMEGRFFCEPLETVPIRGKATPLGLYVPKRVPHLAGASGGQTIESAA